MTCKWCTTRGGSINPVNVDEFIDDFKSGDFRRLCEGCRQAIQEAISNDAKLRTDKR